MKIIYKYTFKIQDEVLIEMPYENKPLCVQMQNGQPCLWAIVEDSPSHHKANFLFKIIATGQDMGKMETGLYIGTIQDGPFVWHVFKC